MENFAKIENFEKTNAQNFYLVKLNLNQFEI